jgi:hypothetical protein
MSQDHGVPGDVPTVTSDVEPHHSPAPEGIVLPKVAPSLYWIVATATGVILIVIAINYYYFNVAT